MHSIPFCLNDDVILSSTYILITRKVCSHIDMQACIFPIVTLKHPLTFCPQSQ